MIPLRWVEIDKADTYPDEFPWNLPAIAHRERLEFTAPVTFLVGENGSGDEGRPDPMIDLHSQIAR